MSIKPTCTKELIPEYIEIFTWETINHIISVPTTEDKRRAINCFRIMEYLKIKPENGTYFTHQDRMVSFKEENKISMPPRQRIFLRYCEKSDE